MKKAVLVKISYLISALALLNMMSIVVANIIGRTFFNSPIFGTVEISGFSGLILVCLSMIFAEMRESNITVDIAFRRFPERLKIYVSVIVYLLSALGIGLLFFSAFYAGMESLKRVEKAPAIGLYLFPFKLFFALSLFALLLVILFHLYQKMKSIRKT